MSVTIFAATAVAAQTLGTNALGIAFIIGAAVMLCALLYGIIANGAVTFGDDETQDNAPTDEKAAHCERHDARALKP